MRCKITNNTFFAANGFINKLLCGINTINPSLTDIFLISFQHSSLKFFLLYYNKILLLSYYIRC